MNYLSALDILHDTLRPSNYVEIGCRKGISLARAACPCIAIDPEFEIIQPLEAPTRIFRETSDDFFAARDLRAMLCGPVDLAFVDGMHHAEFVLRDVLNLERNADTNTVIVIDDVLPADISYATRERHTQAWTGDVYKIVPFLRRHRPDLSVEVFDIEMKGLAIVHGLNPGSAAIQTDIDTHVRTLSGDELALGSIDDIRRALAPRPAAELNAFASMLKKRRGPLPASKPGGAPDYLDLLKRSLLNEIYLDDELRLQYLRDCLAGRQDFDYGVLHEIRDHLRDDYRALEKSRRIGQFPRRDIHGSGFSHTMMGRERLDSLHKCLDHIRERNIPGDLMECGVWRGGGCIFMAGYLRAFQMNDRRVIAADSFEGLPAPSHRKDGQLDLSKAIYPELAVSEACVRENFAVYGLLDDRVIFLSGWFRDTLPDAPVERLALLRLDGDLYESTMDALVNLYDRVSPGGIVVVDDYGALEMCREAVSDFFANRGEDVPELHTIDWTGAYFVKPDAANSAARGDAVS